MIKKNGTQKPRKSQNNAGPLSFREFCELCVGFEEKSHRNATDGHGYQWVRIKAHGKHRGSSIKDNFCEFREFI